MPVRWRRAAYKGVAGAIAIAIGLSWGSPVGSQAPEFSNGTANATALGIKVNPTAAALSLGITFGTALSQYTNDVARAESRGIDLGIIGTTMAGEPCDGGEPSFPAEDQPQPLSADSRQPDAAAGKSSPEVISGQTIPGFEKFVKATPEPMGEALARVAAVGETGMFAIDGATTKTVTRVIDKKTREAVATTEIQTLDLGGQLRLSGLKWESIHRSGAEQAATGTFSVGSATLAGTPLPLPPGDPAAAFGAINTALKPVGIELRAPGTRDVNGAVTVDPLTIAIVPAPERDAITGQILSGALPVRQAVIDFLLAQDCGNDTYVTIADIVVGSITGAGSFSLELGGVQAHSGELKLSSFLQSPGGFGDGPVQLSEDLGATTGELTSIAGTPAIAGTPGIPGGAIAGAQKGRSGSRGGKELASPVASTKGTRGGKMALLAGGTLLLLAAVAELDRRKMRAALTATTEA